MMKHYKSILEKLVFFQKENNSYFIKSNCTSNDSFTLLNDFEKELVKLLIKDRCIMHYGQSSKIYNIITTFFIIRDNRLIFIFDGFFRFDSNIVDQQTFSYIINECEDLIYYYEDTDNV